MLWICLHFPDLCLQIFQRAAPRGLAVASRGRRAEVLACDAAAERLGIRPGMKLSAAQALSAQVHFCERDEGAETAALAAIALWAGQFTPTVSLAPPAEVLLEIGGCLKLFGGMEPLLARIQAEVIQLGYDPVIASAPTPGAAQLLARAGMKLNLTASEQIERHLAPLSLSVLSQPPAVLSALAEIGVRTLGECLRLPREGLARRYGQALIGELDRALAKLPDPRPPFIAPALYRNRLELPFPVADVEPLVFAAKRLVLELAGFLRGRAAGVAQFRLQLIHDVSPPTQVVINLSLPSRDAEQMFCLLRERLSRVALPERVEALELCAGEMLPLASRDLSFLPDRKAETRAALVERLRARLGDDAVFELSLTSDYRPECAWHKREGALAANAESHGRQGLRPLWLLLEPLPLEPPGETPWLRGPLTLCRGPERIESGWWDGNGVCRDYFLARSLEGASFWIFRERGRRRRWFVHGIFA